ncbi:hypothetical protein SULI_07580 [Saccharolobus solfataricus]|uniref:Uncharacterized protein n=3 Tax=Saccharolobus solfataricus TaxID=2287 RepID=Q97ZT0_SACS2|nr:hypothetical protein [Saccharolobus solfataricus]AAK40818.1 Hypothetical protein SSO0499 [Saccharolobus solfataricus P2]AKA73791.1 hypothetical protein SULB_1523 [Saccharolobus solfataricus]AKA76488.1 hypothetical protein SULC_1521 [Saccharolobus solfataricus]AKA79181.1 hypothetical protein SULA_1522 [Saccharolobus solfataricus]AZF68267.1 hypothetical protein SULG_07580 [Saccharolobus solfataricus]
MKEESYRLLEYVVEHGLEGTLTALETNKGIPIVLVKEDPHTLTTILCIDGIARRITKRFTRTTVHKAIYELIDEIESMISQPIEELRISQKVSFENCIEERGEEKPKRKKRETPRLPSIDEYKRIEIPQKHVIPLLYLGDRKYLSLILELGIIDIIESLSSSPIIIENNQVTPYKIRDMRAVYNVLSLFKLDRFNNSNPFSTISLNRKFLTFFTALYNDVEVLGQTSISMLQRNLKLVKHRVKMFSASKKGNLHTEEVEILNNKNSLERNDIRVGLFLRSNDGNTVQIGDINLGELHEKNVFTVNEYIYSSLYMMEDDDYLFFDNILMKLLNTYIAKSNYSKLTRDIIERETNINYSIPIVMRTMANRIELANPILYWYSKEILNSDEICINCPIIEYVNKFNEFLNNYVRLGYFRSVFL